MFYGGGTLYNATKVTDNLVTNNPFSTFEATAWSSTGPFTPQWYIGYDFAQPTVITEIALAVNFFLGTSLTHLIVEASDNGTDYFQVADFPAITHGTYENWEGGGTPTWTSTTTYVMQF